MGGMRGMRGVRGMRKERDDDRHYDRVLWRSRRGMLELDLVLVGFARARYSRLPCAEREAYRALLDEDDWTVWEWLQRRTPPPAALARIVDRILGFVADGAHQPRG